MIDHMVACVLRLRDRDTKPCVDWVNDRSCAQVPGGELTESFESFETFESFESFESFETFETFETFDDPHLDVNHKAFFLKTQ